MILFDQEKPVISSIKSKNIIEVINKTLYQSVFPNNYFDRFDKVLLNDKLVLKVEYYNWFSWDRKQRPKKDGWAVSLSYVGANLKVLKDKIIEVKYKPIDKL